MSNLKSILSTSILLGAIVTASSVGAQQTFFSFENTDARHVTFPDMDKAWVKSGGIMDPKHPYSMTLGLTKNQVRSIVSYPHFGGAMFDERQWDYIFNFKRSDGPDLVCQYQVQFDKDARTKGMYWKTKECMDFVHGIKAVKTPITLAADGLFKFGKSGYNDLLPTGQQELSKVVRQFKDVYKVSDVKIVGHTDRIGSLESNMVLSRARAETVRMYLANNGVPASLMSASGMGPTKPVVDCPGPKSPVVIACLQPNRRVDITLTGAEK